MKLPVKAISEKIIQSRGKVLVRNSTRKPQPLLTCHTGIVYPNIRAICQDLIIPYLIRMSKSIQDP